MQLQELFEISTGYTFREAIDSYGTGTVGVIQAGDINEDRLTQIVRIDFVGDRHLLKAGDLVLSARGKSLASTVTTDLLPAVAASSVLVLRPRNAEVQSAFVTCYLNSQVGQAELAKVASGAYIKTLRKSELAQLVIPLPPPDTQQRIVKLAETIKSQNALLKQKQSVLDTLWNIAVAHTVKEHTR